MIQAAIASLILVGIYKLLKPSNDVEIDWWMAFIFVLVPALITFLIVFFGVGILGLPPIISLLSYPIYFLVPFGILKAGLDFKIGEAAKFAIFVPVVIIALEIIYVFVFGMPNA